MNKVLTENNITMLNMKNELDQTKNKLQIQEFENSMIKKEINNHSSIDNNMIKDLKTEALISEIKKLENETEPKSKFEFGSKMDIKAFTDKKHEFGFGSERFSSKEEELKDLLKKICEKIK